MVQLCLCVCIHMFVCIYISCVRVYCRRGQRGLNPKPSNLNPCEQALWTCPTQLRRWQCPSASSALMCAPRSSCPAFRSRCVRVCVCVCVCERERERERVSFCVPSLYCDAVRMHVHICMHAYNLRMHSSARYARAHMTACTKYSVNIPPCQFT